MNDWLRLHGYRDDLLTLEHRVYALEGKASLVDYYFLDYDGSNIDKNILGAGAYDIFDPEFSGMRWRRVSGLPVYDASFQTLRLAVGDTGVTKDPVSFDFVIPSEYGIHPQRSDFVCFRSEILDPGVNPPIFQVAGIEASTNTTRRFWKLTAQVSQYFTNDIDPKVNASLVFVDQLKSIHPSSAAVLALTALGRRADDARMVDSTRHSSSTLYFGV